MTGGWQTELKKKKNKVKKTNNKNSDKYLRDALCC